MELFKRKISFLGLEIGNGKIELQPHIAEKLTNFPDKLEGLKQIQAFLGLLNYARKFIPNLSKLAGPLYSKTTKNGQRHFNKEDRVPDLEKVISTKIFKEFPEHLIHLQKEIIELGFSSNYMNNSRPNFKRKYKGVILRQRLLISKNLNMNQIIAQVKDSDGPII